jgi:hypothetical protein
MIEPSRFPTTWMLLLIATMNGCLTHSPAVPPDLHPRSVIFSAAEVRPFLPLLHHCGGQLSSSPSGVWDPTVERVAEVDLKVRIQLESNLSGMEVDSQDYYIQYMGLILSGRQVILANGVHAAMARNYLPDLWRSRLIVICDLGRGGFRSEYDVENGRLGNLTFSEQFSPSS